MQSFQHLCAVRAEKATKATIRGAHVLLLVSLVILSVSDVMMMQTPYFIALLAQLCRVFLQLCGKSHDVSLLLPKLLLLPLVLYTAVLLLTV